MTARRPTRRPPADPALAHTSGALALFADDEAADFTTLATAGPATGPTRSAAAWDLLARCLDGTDLVPPRAAPADPASDLDPDERWRLAQARAFDRLTAAAYAPATLRGYGHHVQAWAQWCRDRDIDPLPLDPGETVAFLMAYAFITDDAGDFATDDEGHLVPARAASSVAARLAALNKLASFAGVGAPGDQRSVQVMMRGVRRRLGIRPQHAREAIDLALLRRFLLALDGVGARALRDRLLVLLRAQAHLSAHDVATLDWFDLTVASDHVRIRRPDGDIVLARAGEADLCLVQALTQAKAQALATGAFPGPVFRGRGGSPLSRQAVFEAVKALIRRSQLTTTWHDLPDLAEADLRHLLAVPATRTAASRRRNRALLTLGWHGALRRSEIVGLNWGDISAADNGVWRITLRFSKTDQEGLGQTIRIAPSPDDAVVPCALAALTAWRHELQTALGRTVGDDEPVFPPFTPHGDPRTLPRSGRLARLDGEEVNALIKRLAVEAGLVARGAPCPYGGHSLRAGFVTEALRGDRLSISQVQEQTRHKDVGTLLRYRREVNLDHTNASTSLLSSLTQPD
jgi:integrase